MKILRLGNPGMRRVCTRMYGGVFPMYNVALRYGLGDNASGSAEGEGSTPIDRGWMAATEKGGDAGGKTAAPGGGGGSRSGRGVALAAHGRAQGGARAALSSRRSLGVQSCHCRRTL